MRCDMERRSNSIADQIFEILERDILSEKFPRGEVLTENRLSELLEVSRTPVREALRRLEQEHLIEMTTKGALVIGISKEDIVTIYEMRLRLEGMAASAAAENASPSDIAELREILDMQEFYTAKGDADNIKNADSRFHRAIYRASGSVPLCDTLTDLHKKIIKYRKASVSDKSRAAESLAEHRAVLDAISRGDRALAEELTVTHIRNAMQHIIEN
jgi:DNA-binding GntR family transcriptional regulator